MINSKGGSIDKTPKNDVIFKILFADPKHPKLLIALLNGVLKPKDPIVAVSIQSPELKKEYLMQRGVRLDILATDEKGEIINIEMQKKDEHNMRERAVFHCSRLFAGQAEVSDKYEDLKKTTVISVLNFNLFDNDSYWNKFFLMNPETKERLTDLVEIHFLEIPKARKKGVKDPLEFWLKFIDNPEADEIKHSYLWDEVFKEATECYKKVIADPETQELIRIREKAEMDYNSRMYAETEKARKEEREKAKKEKFEMARRMLAMGLSLEQVAQISGLSAKEIENLR